MTAGAFAQPALGPNPPDDALRVYAVHINRTPTQSWPGYGVYLGDGYVLTAAHVPGNFAETKPRAVVGGVEEKTTLVKQGSLEGVDLTALAVDVAGLPAHVAMRRLPLCAHGPSPGEAVVVITPESVARSHVLPPAAVPLEVRGRFSTVIGDVATTGNSGSGVLDARQTCLLGIISRKISMTLPSAPGIRRDVAKYFVPVDEIRAFLPMEARF
jgi:hypothetical protein